MVTTAFTFEVAYRGLTIYRTNPRYARWMWNEVDGRRIGVAVRWGQWAWSLRWRRA